MGRSAARLRLPQRPGFTLAGCGLLLAAFIVATSAALILNLRERDLADAERELQNLAVVLAEETDRSFQAVSVVQTGLIERMQAQGIASSAAYARQMAGEDTHALLRDKIAALPQVDAVTMIDAEGRLINFSRYWPIPPVNVADRDYFQALKADPKADWFVSEPVPNRGTGTWSIYLARKFAGPDRAFLGLVLGAMQLRYFEESYKAIALNADSAISLFRSDGILLARHPHINPLIGRSYVSGGVFRNILAQADHGVTRLTSTMDGKNRIVAARTLRHYPVVVTVSTTEAAALAAWRQEAAYVAVFAGLAVLIVAGAVCLSTLLIRRHIAARDLVARARAETAEAERARAVAEAELLKKERLSVLGHLTATVAHELRNPLSAVRNTVYAIGQAAAARGLALDRQMTRVERSIARCDGIIADLLEYTRAREVNRVPTPLDAWLGEVLDELQIPEGIAVERRFGASEGFVELDVNRFRRVVINLVDNALQAVAENKAPDAMRRIAVTTRLAERAEITIEDSGPGIPPEVLPRVFEPLFSTKSFGTGLGLPTVKQIVEQHGGTIAIASRMGSGTAVHVSLPSGAAAKEAA